MMKQEILIQTASTDINFEMDGSTVSPLWLSIR